MSAQDLEHDLDAYVLGDLIPPDEPPPPPTDAHGATRLLAAVRYRERDIENVKEIARRRIEPIEEWRKDRIAGAVRSIEFIERSLEVWMRRRHDESGMLTENLPDGELRVRPGKQSMVATDEDAAVLWARFGNERRHLIRAKFEIDKAKAKEELGAGTPLSTTAILALGLGELPDTHKWCSVVDADGVSVPGLVIAEPVKRVFGYTTNKKKDPVQQTMMEETDG